jgi:uncharacterized protein (TIGR01777 family)
MKILLTGATGLVGKEIGKALVTSGHEVVALTRDAHKAKSELPFPALIVEWRDYNEKLPSDALKGVEAVIHLAGESIAGGRWNKSRKKLIYDSRILSTRSLVEAIQNQVMEETNTVKHFISTSAIGIYGSRGDEILIEDSKFGSDFLAKVCVDWEKETVPLKSLGIRVVNPRIGIVLSRQGGALDKMLPLFTTGLGSAIGSGNQWMSWIHHEDLTGLFLHALENQEISGPINAVAPNPVTNKEFSRALANSLKKWLFFPVPGFVLQVVLGEMSALVLGSQMVSANKAIESHYKFKYPTIDEALIEISSPLVNGHREIFTEQWVPKKPDDVFPFFTDEQNLEKLTPKFLNFKVLKKSTPQITQGTLIDYKLGLHGVPISWQTKIENWTPGQKFVDTQLKGPYKLWHHTHEFIDFAGGTLLRDRVIYKIPFGTLGNLALGLKIKSDVSQIFSYRRKIISSIFYPEKT